MPGGFKVRTPGPFHSPRESKSFGVHRVCMCAQVCLWTVSRQVPLTMGFSSKNTGVGCHFLLQGGCFQLRHWTHVSCIAGRSLTCWAILKALEPTFFFNTPLNTFSVSWVSAAQDWRTFPLTDFSLGMVFHYWCLCPSSDHSFYSLRCGS